MGAWGVKLYESDAALDVRDLFATWSRIPGTTDELVRAVAGEAGAPDDPADEDYADVWLALTDQLHAYGLHDEATFARARAIVASGSDEAAKLAQGLSPRDARRRREVLAGLLERWAMPHPRPKARKLLERPEAYAFPAGTILAYPTCGGEPRNYADVANRLGWFADGWGSAVILAAGHVGGWFAWTAAARLSAHGQIKPGIDQCLAGAIENQPWSRNPSGEGTIAVQVGALPPLHAKRMGLVALGHIDLERSKIEQLDLTIDGPEKVPPPSLYSVLTWWEPGVKPLREHREESIACPRGVIPLKALGRQP